MSQHDYNIACEPDSTDKSSAHLIWAFVILALVLFGTIAGLTILFRFQADYERKEKIGQVMTEEILDYRAINSAYLSGKHGIFHDKNNVGIEEAKKIFLKDFRN